MNTKQMERSIAKHTTGHKMPRKGKFAAGIAFGTVVGSAIVLYTAKMIDKAVASGKMADAGAVLKRTGDRTQRIGNTVKYTVRSMSGRMMKGADSIKREIGKGAHDIRKTMQS